ncbi:MAG: glycine zipper 2TM domain-containing protein [Nitrospirales bacterium]|nr:glycine zipper 2TM domain-containing protein [Nitrospirales bacterium]
MISLLLAGTAYATPQWEGGTAGGLIGGIAGALLDHKNPWRGGVIGAGLGAIAGATIADISVRGSQEAARANRPVEYTTGNGRGIYRAEPVGAFYYPDRYKKCKKVHERTWENGSLVRDTVREVCEGVRAEERYGTPLAYEVTPPPYAVAGPPPVVLIPGTYVYAVPASAGRILYYDGSWWRPVRGHWYRSGHHDGPWMHVRFDRVPYALRDLPPDYPRMLYGQHRACGDVRDHWDGGERE